MKSEMLEKEVFGTGKVIEQLKVFRYNSMWSIAKDVLVVDMGHGYKTYLTNYPNTPVGEDVSFTGKVIGQHDRELVPGACPRIESLLRKLTSL